MTRDVEALKRALLNYDCESSEKYTREAIQSGIDPILILREVTETSRQVGDAYARGELFLPDLVGMADAMMSIMPLLEESILASGGKPESLGTIVAGTVIGDIHSIGMSMVVTLARAAGFRVIDLGVDVSPDKYLEAVKKYHPDILAMSALLTTTAWAQKGVIESLKGANLRDTIKVVVGGGAITEEFARTIGADGYRPTAPMAVDLFREFVGKGN